MEPHELNAVCQPRDGIALNGRLCLVYSEHYQIHLGGKERMHPFDINTYARTYLQLVRSRTIRPEDVFVPQEISEPDILRVHTKEYLDSLRKPDVLGRYLESGALSLLPAGMVDSGILRAFRYATGGTLLAGRLALQYGIAINFGGGYHHADRMVIDEAVRRGIPIVMVFDGGYSKNAWRVRYRSIQQIIAEYGKP